MGLSQPHSRSHLELGGPNSGRPVTRKFDATTRRISFLRASLHRTSSLRADLLNSQYAGPCRPKAKKAVFYFIIFYFRFLQKYIFMFQIYMNIPRPPGSRAADAYLQKKVDKKLRRGPCRTDRPAAGRPALQAARQRDSGPWPPACRVTGPPNPI